MKRPASNRATRRRLTACSTTSCGSPRAGGMPADLAIDRATGAFAQVTYEPDDRYNRTAVRILGYTEIAPGVRVPTAYRYGRETTLTLLRGAARPVTDEEMQRPAAPTAAWTFGNGDPVRFDVERGTWAGRAVVVHASINGKPGRFLFDSGASQVLLYRPYADSLGLTMLGTTAFSGVNGASRSARFARAASISIGDNTLSNVVLAISAARPRRTRHDRRNPGLRRSCRRARPRRSRQRNDGAR